MIMLGIRLCDEAEGVVLLFAGSGDCLDCKVDEHEDANRLSNLFGRRLQHVS
jgi:hypothetical protein